MRPLALFACGLLAATAALLAGCRQVPTHQEPGGHSTTYRSHLDEFDATFAPVAAPEG
jgi:hypothetical protein